MWDKLLYECNEQSYSRSIYIFHTVVKLLGEVAKLSINVLVGVANKHEAYFNTLKDAQIDNVAQECNDEPKKEIVEHDGDN